MSNKQRKFVIASVILALAFGIVPTANAMHIMEGYLPRSYCIIWGIICIPFLLAGFFSIKKTLSEHRKVLIILAMSGAYAFVLSALKIPSIIGGSSSHMTGTGLGAILFGPSAMSLLGLIVLVFQALLIAHGGLSTLGANTFSMAIAGPFITFGVYRLLLKLLSGFGVKGKYAAIFFAACLGNLFTYCITAFQLGIAFPVDSGGVYASVVKFMGVFALTQIPLAVIEGLITVAVMMGLESYARSELTTLGYLRRDTINVK